MLLARARAAAAWGSSPPWWSRVRGSSGHPLVAAMRALRRTPRPWPRPCPRGGIRGSVVVSWNSRSGRSVAARATSRATRFALLELRVARRPGRARPCAPFGNLRNQLPACGASTRSSPSVFQGDREGRRNTALGRPNGTWITVRAFRPSRAGASAARIAGASSARALAEPRLLEVDPARSGRLERGGLLAERLPDRGARGERVAVVEVLGEANERVGSREERLHRLFGHVPARPEIVADRDRLVQTIGTHDLRLAVIGVRVEVADQTRDSHPLEPASHVGLRIVPSGAPVHEEVEPGALLDARGCGRVVSRVASATSWSVAFP